MILEDELFSEREKNRNWLKNRFYDMDRPELYLGDEMNTFHFDWETARKEKRLDNVWRIALLNLTSDNYTFSATEIMLFYEQLHEYDPSWVVERSLIPPSRRNQDLMKEDGIRPFAVESGMPLTAFNAICISLNLTTSHAALPWLLLTSGIPLDFAQRTENDPFVILGGASLVNPEPLRPFCDIFFFGEGEEVLPELLSLLETGKRSGRSREEILLEAARRWDCLYMPMFYEERYDADGRFAGTFPLRNDVPEKVRFYRVPDPDRVFLPKKPFLPFGTDSTALSSYEISKGCEGKCSFCLSGFISLPFRPRSAELIREMTERIVYETGNTSVIPVSFNSVSHPQINQIVHDLNDRLGDKVRITSMRIDGFQSNPELCCYVSMLQRGNTAFGVEGASQRLRDLVSKNLTTEQILDTMREVARNGCRCVKFMMICNLPGETMDDLDELYDLAVNIRDIFEKETPSGIRPPKLLITWTPLMVSPHTPLQWAPVHTRILPEYEAFTKKICELGFRTFTPEMTPSDFMAQLFIRGDARLSGLLAALAEEGYVDRNGTYGPEIYEKTKSWLEENGLPSPEEWFREYRYEDPLPWDIVRSPASKEYLYRRYLAMKEEHPHSDPICSAGCSGCGGCGVEHRRALREMQEARERDRRTDLHHPVRKTDFHPVQYVLLEYTIDPSHSTVKASYWDCELRRALFHAGLLFDPDSVQTFGGAEFVNLSAAGPNAACISLGKKYDPEELLQSINEHAVNIRVLSVSVIDAPVRVHTAVFSMALPEGCDPGEIRDLTEKKLSEEKWTYSYRHDALFYPVNWELRSAVRDITVRDDRLLIKMGPSFTDPRLVYRYLFDIPSGQLLKQAPVREGFTFENKGVLDIAMTREKRDAFLRHLEDRNLIADREYRSMAAYIGSESVVRDLQSLIRRDYTMPPPFHFRIPKNFSGSKRDLYVWKGHHNYMLKLITFCLHDQESIYCDGLYSFRSTRTAKDLLLRLSETKNKKDYYIIKADVSNYVSSIVPELIIPQIEKLWKDDPAFADLLKYILLRRECIERDGTVVKCEPGGLGGVPLSNLFMNLYLMDMDEWFYPRAALYCRYSDDILIFARTREEAEGYLEHFHRVLREKRLYTNHKKTKLIEPEGAVDILGFCMHDGKMDVSAHTKQKLKRKIRMQAGMLLKQKKENGWSGEECGKRMIGYCRSVFFGDGKSRKLTWARWIFPVITDTASLKELDSYIQDAVRFCMCGSMSKKRYRITHQDLRRLGYRSLVNSYYHFRRK